MTEEQATKLVELLEEYNKNFNTSFVLVSILMALLLIFIAVEIYMNKKRKKTLEEYKSTLTDKQLKALAKYKELNK